MESSPSNENQKKKENKPYRCQIDIAFPTLEHALQCKDVLIVDDEIGDRVTKYFSVHEVVDENNDGGGCKEDVTDDILANGVDPCGDGGERKEIDAEGINECEEKGTGKDEKTDANMASKDSKELCSSIHRRENVLRVNIRATEAKMLRVSVSSFYDMLNVFLKCQQEFG